MTTNPAHTDTPALPRRLAPMLAHITGPFDSDQHIFELKWDGMRCLTFVERNRFSLQNRRFFEVRDKYPELAVLQNLPGGTLVDGEIVVLQQGLPSFTKLMQREHTTDPRRAQMLQKQLLVAYAAFDLLYDQGRSIMGQPLLDRRARLTELIGSLGARHVFVPSYVEGAGQRYFDKAGELGFEGIMAKRRDSQYYPGKRSTGWYKIKPTQIQVFDVLGYRPGTAADEIGSLTLGQREGDRWIYRGQVGTGFSRQQRRELRQQLDALPPLKKLTDHPPPDAVWRDTGWRCRVRFFEWTDDQRLRGPVFLGWA